MENNTTSFPKNWPGAFEIYKISRDRVRANLKPLIWLAVLPFIVDVVVSVVLALFFDKDTTNIISNILSFLVGLYFSVVTTRAYLLAAREKDVELDVGLFATPSKLVLRVFLLEILTFFSVVGGMILLVVPGIIIGMRLSMALYFLIDKDMTVLEAYKASWHATKGHLGKLWGIIGVGLLMILPSITIIGILATVYLFFMYSAVGALYYLHLRAQHSNSKKRP